MRQKREDCDASPRRGGARIADGVSIEVGKGTERKSLSYSRHEGAEHLLVEGAVPIADFPKGR